MNKICIVFLLIVSTTCYAQKSKTVKPKTASIKKEIIAEPLRVKAFELDPHLDTINRVMTDNLRYGNWVEKTAAAFGEDATYKFGNYAAGRKEGKWYSYTNDVISLMETYKNGVRDGEIRYFDEGRIVLRGYYKASKIPQKDTISVVIPQTQMDSTVFLVNDTRSYKEGIWTYYKPNGSIEYKEYYYFDELLRTEIMQQDDVMDKEYIPEPNKMRQPTQVQVSNTDPFVKQNKGKMPVRYTEFRADGKDVRPNKRKR